MSEDLGTLFPTTATPVFETHSAGQCDHSQPLTILKLHGSLNWLVRINSVRPTPSVLTGSRARDLMLLTGREAVGRVAYVRRNGRGRSRWSLWPIVVPPVYAKTALRGAMKKAWADARTAVEQADRLLIFGYSLSAIDIEAEKLFERSIAQNDNLPHSDVINPAHESAARFAEVGRKTPMHWYPSVDAMLASDEISNAGF